MDFHPSGGTGTTRTVDNAADLTLNTGATIQASGGGNLDWSGITSFTIARSDGSTDIRPALDGIVFTLANAAPSLASPTANATYTENGSAVAVDSAFTISDSNGDNITGGTVSITANRVAGDTLAVTDQLGITSAYNSTTGVLTLSGTTSAANYQTVLRTLTYVSSSDTPGSSTRTLTYSFSDGSASGTATQGGNSLQIDFNANATNPRVQTLLRNIRWSAAAGAGAQTFTATLNDADGVANGGDQDATANFTMTLGNPPVIINLDGDTVTFTEDTAVVLDSASNATIADSDNPVSLIGGNLRATVSAGADAAQDILTVSGSATLASMTAGADVSVSGTVIGTLANAVTPGNDFQVDFNASAILARIETLIRSLTYNNQSQTPTTGNRTVAVTATDAAGNEGSDASTDELTITTDGDGDGVDDAVENAGPNGGDGNNDGTPDAEQANVTSVPTATRRGYMTLDASGACTELLQVAAIHAASLPADPNSSAYPFGLVEFRLPCESAIVEVIYHDAAAGEFADSTYRKYGPVTPGDAGTKGWYDFSEYATFTGNTWTLDLGDDRLGDDTGDDGIIVDQGGPANALAVPIPVDRTWALLLLFLSSLILAHRYLPRTARRDAAV